MKEETRARNRRHLIKALALGLAMETRGEVVEIQSESDPAVWHRVERRAGRWFCGCQWATSNAEGYDPHSDLFACKHILLAIAARLPVKRQDAIVAGDPAFRAAAASGAQIRARRGIRPAFSPDRFAGDVVAEAQAIAARARAQASPDPEADGSAAAAEAVRRARVERGRLAGAELFG